jgi:hypothetical protein
VTKRSIAILICLMLAGGVASGETVSLKSLPPSIINTVPQCGDTKVDALSTNRIQVTFSKDMTDGSWSWVKISDDTFPQLLGKPKYLEDKRTCVIDTKLEPNKIYVIWVNSEKFQNFKDTDGNVAVPYLLFFQTK